MRILTSNLKSVQKIWNQIRVRGIQYYDYVHLDFHNRILSFMNSTTVVKVNLNLEDNDGKGLEHDPMFIDGSKFFSLVQFYDYVDLEDKTFYSSSGDKFVIPELEEEIEIPNGEFHDWKTVNVDFNADLNKELSLAMSYVESDMNSEFSSLFIQNGVMFSYNHYRMFHGDTSISGIEFNVPYTLLKLITSLNMMGAVELKTRTLAGGASMTEFSYGDIWIRYSASSKYELPFDPDSDDFKSSYDHETNFVVSMDTIQEAIKFLTAYMVDVSEAVCQCRFSTSDPDDMVMTLHLDYTGAVDYRVKMEKCSDTEYFDGQSAFIYLNSIRSAIGILAQYGVKNVNITFDSDAAAMKFSDDDGECPVFVIHTVTEEI